MASRLKEVVLNPTAIATALYERTTDGKIKKERTHHHHHYHRLAQQHHPLTSSKWRRDVHKNVSANGFKTSLEWEFISSLLSEHSADTSIMRSIIMSPPPPPPQPVISIGANEMTSLDGIDIRSEITTLSTQLSMDIMVLSIRTNIPVTLIKREYLRYKRRKRTRIQTLQMMDLNIDATSTMPPPIIPPPTPPSIPFESCLTGSVNGLPNYGQTCFFNAVIQALASSTPFIRYLERLVFLIELKQQQHHHSQQHSKMTRTSGLASLFRSQSFLMGMGRSDKEQQPMCRLLLDVLTYVNCYTSASASTSASQIHKKIRQILDRVARNHEQFKSYRSHQHSNEQQDSQECLQAMMAIIIEESELEKKMTHHDDDDKGGDNDKDDGDSDYEEVGVKPKMQMQMKTGEDRIGLGSKLFIQDELYQQQNDDATSTHHTLIQIHETEEEYTEKEEKKEDQDDAAANNSIDDNDDDDGSDQGRGDDRIDHNDDKVKKKLAEGTETETNTSAEIDTDIMDMESESNNVRATQILESNLSRPMQMMIQSLSSKTPSPLNGCVGSRLECCECGHVRRIQDAPFLEIPIVPTAISKSMMMGVSSSPSTSRPGSDIGSGLDSSLATCTLMDCLEEFTEEERVHGVNCQACPIKENLKDLTEEERMLHDAISSVSGRIRMDSTSTMDDTTDDDKDNNPELSALKEDLKVICDRIDFLRNVDPDEDIAVEDKAETNANENECDEDVYDDDLLQMVNIDTNAKLLVIPKPVKVDMKKRLMVTRLPPVLCLHVKRLYYNPATDRMAKCLQHIQFSEFLDLRCIYAGHVGTHREGMGMGKGENENEGKNENTTVENNPIPYRLISVIEHRGNAFSGHYLTYRRIDDKNTSILSSSSWVAVSDQRVSYLSWNDVRNCNAYMLIYEAC